MKVSKRFLSLLLALVMVVGMVPANPIHVHATEAEEGIRIEETTPPTTEAPVEEETTPPTTEAPEEEETTPPTTEAPEEEETTPPTTEAPVEEETTPPTTEAPEEETTPVKVKTTVVQDTAALAATTYDVYVGGVGMASGTYLANKATATRPDKPSVGYAYYQDGVLTLHNYNFSGTGYEIGNDSQTLIYASQALRIVLEGENNLTQTTENNLGIYFAEGGTISGSGSLAISGPCTYGIHVETGDFTCYADYVSVLDCAHGVNVKTGDIWISGGLLDVKVQRNAVAARQGSVMVTDGELTAKSTNGSDSNRAINAANGFSVANHLTVLAAEAYDGVPGVYDAANIKNYDLIMVKNYPILLGVKTTGGMVGESEEGGIVFFDSCESVFSKECSEETTWTVSELRTESGELNTQPVAGETYYFDITVNGENINFSGVSAMNCDVKLDFYDVAFVKATNGAVHATITFSATRKLTHDVLFYFYGDEYPISGRTIEDGQLVTKPDDPGKEGVHFLGWYTEDGELYDFDAPVTKNINLYAVFGHYVTFHVGETTSTQFVADGKTMTEPIPSKEGYAFRGWYTADNKYYDFTTPVTGDLELYAKLVKVHTVTITVRESTFTQIVEDGKTAIKPGISGNGFIGWYTADDQPYDFSTPVTGDLEIYAKFAEYHTVNIYVDGSISTQLVENGKPATEPAVPSKEGYAFTGWYTADNQSYGFGAPITSDLDIYARFVKLHTVTFYVGETTSTQVITDGETVTPPEDPAQEGLVFTGWYTEDGKLYDFTNPVTQDLKLVAYLAGVMVDGVGLLDGDYLPNGSNTTTTTKPSDGYVYYKDGVLTLHNYDYTGAGYKVETEHSAAIYSERNLTIVLDVGTVNKLEATGHYGIYVNNCIDTSAMLTIQGSGTLEIDAAGDGVHVYGDLNFINTELKIVAVNNALYAHGTVTAENTNATINATSNYALYSTKDIVIEDGTWNLSAEALNCIWAENNVSIIDVEVTAECDNVGIGADGLITIGKGSLNINAGSYGVYAKGTVAVSQGSLNITAENRSGVYTTEDIEIESAILDITSGENGLYSDNGNVIVTDCDITIESQGYAISAETGKMLIENTNATLNSDHGIDANDIELKGTTTTMVEINSTKNFGIYSHTDITIESGTWTINSPKQTGILANDSVSISNAIVTVVADRQGIYASDNISIDGCTMDVRSTNTENDNNFCALNGNVIFGSNVSVLASTESDGALYIYKDELLDTYDKIVVGPYCNHSFDSGVVTTEPSCGTKGVKTYTCENCGAKYTQEIKEIGHDYDNGAVTTEPGCETEGVKTYTCKNGCGIPKTEPIEALDHDYDYYNGVVTTEPGCETEGVKTYTCKNGCGIPKTEPIEALDHEYDNGVVTTPANCKDEGVRTYTCIRCPESYTEVVPAFGHQFDDGVVTQYPTLTEKGEKTFTCQREFCDYSYTEDIPAWGQAVFYDISPEVTEAEFAARTANFGITKNTHKFEAEYFLPPDLVTAGCSARIKTTAYLNLDGAMKVWATSFDGYTPDAPGEYKIVHELLITEPGKEEAVHDTFTHYVTIGYAPDFDTLVPKVTQQQLNNGEADLGTIYEAPTFKLTPTVANWMGENFTVDSHMRVERDEGLGWRDVTNSTSNFTYTPDIYGKYRITYTQSLLGHGSTWETHTFIYTFTYAREPLSFKNLTPAVTDAELEAGKKDLGVVNDTVVFSYTMPELTQQEIKDGYKVRATVEVYDEDGNAVSGLAGTVTDGVYTYKHSQLGKHTVKLHLNVYRQESSGDGVSYSESIEMEFTVDLQSDFELKFLTQTPAVTAEEAAAGKTDLGKIVSGTVFSCTYAPLPQWMVDAGYKIENFTYDYMNGTQVGFGSNYPCSDVGDHELVMKLVLKDKKGNVIDSISHTYTGHVGCMVTFMVNDSVYKTEEVEDKSLVAQPADPELDGWKFLGWYTEDDEPFNFYLYIEADTVIYAKLVKTHTVTLMFGDSPVGWLTAEDGKPVEKPEDPAQEGKTFLGWYTDDDELYDFSAPVTEDIKLYAKFETVADDITVTPVGDVDYTVEGNKVTVEHEAVCKVAYLKDGEYVAVEATKNADGSYSYELPEGVTEAIVVVKGDANGDGEFDSSDLARMNAVMLGKTTLSDLGEFAADVNDDTEMDVSDLGRANAVMLGKTALTW